MLVDDDVLGPWLKVVMECATPCPLGKGLSFGPSELAGGLGGPISRSPKAARAVLFSERLTQRLERGAELVQRQALG